MNSFTLECSFYGRLDESVKPPKYHHFGIKDYVSIGSQLAQVIENYLPSEHSKLSVLSGKILEIFYEEFIKFIPPYVLKREEEKNKQMMLNDKQNNAATEVIIQGKSPKIIKQLPDQKSTQLPQRSASIKKQRRSFYYGNVLGGQPVPFPASNREEGSKSAKKIDNRTSFVKKSKIKRKGTNKKSINADEEIQSEGLESIRLIPQQSELDSFSQMINIHSYQDELIDLEFFIKNIKEKEKTQTSLFQLNEEEEEGVQTDSSDSEESVKNIYVQHKFNNPKNSPIKQLQKQKKQQPPKKDHPQVREETDSKTNVLLTEQIRKPVRKMTIIKPLFNQQISSLDLSKNRTETKHILSSDATIEPNIKSLIQKEKKRKTLLNEPIQFDKIPHRKGSSPSHNSKEEEMSIETLQKKIDEAMSRNNRSIAHKSQDESEKRQIIYKTYEQLRQKQESLDRHKVLPLYENPQYHQKRLIIHNSHNKQQELSSQSVNNSSILNSSQHDQLAVFNLKYLNGNQYEPYEEDKSQRILNSKQPQKKQTVINSKSLSKQNQNLSINNNALNQLQISPMTQSESAVPQKRQPLQRPEDIYQQQARAIPQKASQIKSTSIQRMSFKELLQSSRQTRIHDANGSDGQQNRDQPQEYQAIQNHGQLLQMLKNTYQKFQQSNLISQMQKNAQQNKSDDNGSFLGIRIENKTSHGDRSFYEQKNQASLIESRDFLNNSHQYDRRLTAQANHGNSRSGGGFNQMNKKRPLFAQPVIQSSSNPQFKSQSFGASLINSQNLSTPIMNIFPQQSISSNDRQTKVTSVHRDKRVAYANQSKAESMTKYPQNTPKKRKEGLFRDKGGESDLSHANDQQVSQSVNQRLFFMQRQNQLPPSNQQNKSKLLRSSQH